LKKALNIAALYLRLSRDDGGDAESNSIQTQRMMLQRYAKEKGFIVYDEYIDDGWSGTNFTRPNFQRMVSDIDDGKIGVVICKDLSRLGRNNAMVSYYTESYFPDSDIRFIALNDSIDSDVGDNEIMPFKSIINEYYSRDISKKVRSAFRARAQQGMHIGGSIPYGYLRNPTDKTKLIIDTETAPIVKQIFLWAADGLSASVISRRLFQQKVIRPLALENQRHGTHQGEFDPLFPHDWSDTTVAQIFRNEIYTGKMINHKQTTKSFKNRTIVNVPKEDWVIVPNMHEPIISQDLFDKVQAIISVKKRTNVANIQNIFSGLMVCKDCGRKMGFNSYKQSGAYNGRFMCSSYKNGKRYGVDRKCSCHGVNFIVLKECVKSNINEVIRANLDTDILLQKLQASENDNTAVLKKTLRKTGVKFQK
jgi:DNA invertase Pin-like site-specific DNA recombinase